ncbi:hypothetical protein [Neisseria sp.]
MGLEIRAETAKLQDTVFQTAGRGRAVAAIHLHGGISDGLIGFDDPFTDD